MARRVRRFSAYTSVDTVVAVGVETVISTLSGVIGEYADGRVVLIGTVALTGGAGITQANIQIRRGGVGGAVVGELSIVQVPGIASVGATVAVEDSYAAGAPPVYVLTVTPVGGGVTATQTELIALVT